MKNVYSYFDLIDSLIRHSGAIDYEVNYTSVTPLSGLTKGTLYFADGSRLEFTETIVIIARHSEKQVYSYQYLHEDKTIFRYDNSPHHRRLPNFPHHKHIGRKVLSASEPTLKYVLDEIMDSIGQRNL